MSGDCLKETSNSTSSGFERDPASGYIWSQGNHKCSFCKKGFRSAQALGGHMNVHRKERAHLRLSLSPYPSPNPDLISSFSSSSFLAAKCVLSMTNHAYVAPAMTSLSPPSPASSIAEHSQCDFPSISQHKNVRKMPRTKGFFGYEDVRGYVQESEGRVFKKREMVEMDMNMDLLGDANEDLDLELRLGYA